MKVNDLVKSTVGFVLKCVVDLLRLKKMVAQLELIIVIGNVPV